MESIYWCSQVGYYSHYNILSMDGFTVKHALLKHRHLIDNHTKQHSIKLSHNNINVFLKDGASVKQAVVTNRRLRVSTLQWSINKNLSQDILHYEIQLNNSQDVIVVNSSTVTLPAKPNEGSSVNIIAVYRLNGSEVTWRSEAVMVMIKPFGK